MLFYIEANVSAKIAGISGAFQEVYVKLVHARDITEAKTKFEHHVRQVKAHTMPEKLTFVYLKLGDELL